MAAYSSVGPRVAGIVTCVPKKKFNNIEDTTGFTQNEVKKVVAMAGVRERRVAGDSICSSDLCAAAAERLLDMLQWERDSVDCLIMVTQTPDYFLPSTACVLHQRLNLSDACAAFDVGLGCSGYPYGLWLSAMMLAAKGFRRVLLLHGETPSRFSDKADRSVSLLFGDAGSATALERNNEHQGEEWHFLLHTDGNGFKDMIIEGGGFRDRFCKDPGKHYVQMNGAHVFNFTISRVPVLIQATLDLSGLSKEAVDYYIFHQSNKYIIQHITKKMGLIEKSVPMILKDYGNTGGVSVPLTITEGNLDRPGNKSLKLLLLGYGVGLSWSSALIALGPEALLKNIELDHLQKENDEQ